MPEGPSIVILKEAVQSFKGKKVKEVSGNSKIDKTARSTFNGSEIKLSETSVPGENIFLLSSMGSPLRSIFYFLELTGSMKQKNLLQD
jgi:hypothetical protein